MTGVDGPTREGVAAVSPEPYYSDSMVQLYLGKMEKILPTLNISADACIADPPYAETSLSWDSWVHGWPTIVAAHSDSMWCFGSMRMFTDRWNEFEIWKLSQDVVWEKQNGSGFHADRFKRVHELALHFYQGRWSQIFHETPVTLDARKKVTRRKGRPAHTGQIDNPRFTSEDGGPRLRRSVLHVRNTHGRAIHPTQKPIGILSPLVEYSVPMGGLVLDPFAGSGSTLLTARSLGRRAIGIEANEEYCERAAKRLAEPDLFGGAV